MTQGAEKAAYGGPGWRPRPTTLKQELGGLWAPCGIDSEWGELKAVLLHRPGHELESVIQDPERTLMLESPDPEAMQIEHDGLADAYRSHGVAVSSVDPQTVPPPNQLYSADLMAMTPEGAILGRPASEVRAGEERWMARALANLGIPILRSVRGSGTFEGADLMWPRPGQALLAQGLRTNAEGASQVVGTLRELGVAVHLTQLPPGTMHLMGQLRIMDRDLAIAWPNRLPADAVDFLQGLGFNVHLIPDEEETRKGFALNVVTLGPRRVLMPGGNPITLAFFEELGIECITLPMGEIGKAAGSIGCLTGILARDPVPNG